MDERIRKYIVISIIVTVSVTVTLILGAHSTYSIEVIGEQYGLRVKVSDVFVPTDNLYPGDTEVSTMTISVVQVDEVEASSLPVWFSWEVVKTEPGKGGGYLDDKLEFSLYLDDGTLLYNGRFSGLTAPIALGNIAMGDSKILTFKVHLPGENTGNEYMAASLTVKWTVMTRYEPDVTPTPSESPSPTPFTTPSDSPSPTPSTTPSDSPSPTPSTTPSDEPSPMPTATPSDDPSPTPSTTPSDDPSPTPSTTPSDSPSPTPSTTPSDSPSPTPTSGTTPTPTSSPWITPVPGSRMTLPPDFPKTGEPTPILFYGLGAILILAGVIIGKKKIHS